MKYVKCTGQLFCTYGSYLLYIPEDFIFFAIAFISSNSSWDNLEKSSNSIVSFAVFILGMWWSWSDASNSTLVPIDNVNDINIMYNINNVNDISNINSINNINNVSNINGIREIR